MKRSLLLLGALFLLRCAAVGPPPGGPEDKTPPALLSTSPPSGTTGVEDGLTIELTFSERLHEETDGSAIRLAPSIQGPLDVSLNREVLSVSFPNELAENQTYILTLTRDLMDERKNRLDQTYQIAFSTGDEIAAGHISGTVYGTALGSSALVYLFQQGEVSDDSLLLRSPHYFTETDDSGRYAFDYLDEGRYIPVAHTGQSPPSPITPSRNPYGLTWEEFVTVNDSIHLVEDVNIILGREVGPFHVLSVEMDDAVSGSVGFSVPFDLADAPGTKMSFVHSELGTEVPVVHLFQYQDDRKALRFVADGLNAGEVYSISIEGLIDSINQMIEAVDRTIRVPETDLQPPAVHSPTPKVGISVNSGGPPLVLQFTKPVHLVGDSALVLTDTKTGIVNSVISLDLSRVEMTPEDGWTEGSAYQLKLFGAGIESGDGQTLVDSVLNFEIASGAPQGRGGLIGSVQGAYVAGTILTARPVEKDLKSVSVSVNSDGEFKINNLFEGNWMLSTFQDRDGNGRYSFGRLFPYSVAEPFTALNDTIEVRANWDIDGIVLTYPGENQP
ncbi:MAG: hypothetical protein CMG71_04045 [Candidatus Marinimicrobia bacterium]|nr:hypothetical protein [Candidatus Neomarinimicrobiota bacterium]|tara:strand:- start:3318 stop:4988 length:1671 start_codon:yes stop_codon:yes gene_type:complete